MNNVKKLCIVIGDYEVKYYTDGKNNITSKMRDLWKKEHTAVLDVLRNNGIVTESDAFEMEDCDLNIELSNELSFSKSVEIVSLFESMYNIEKCCFQAVHDKWQDGTPNFLIIMKTK